MGDILTLPFVLLAVFSVVLECVFCIVAVTLLVWCDTRVFFSLLMGNLCFTLFTGSRCRCARCLCLAMRACIGYSSGLLSCLFYLPCVMAWLHCWFSVLVGGLFCSPFWGCDLALRRLVPFLVEDVPALSSRADCLSPLSWFSCRTVAGVLTVLPMGLLVGFCTPCSVSAVTLCV